MVEHLPKLELLPQGIHDIVKRVLGHYNGRAEVALHAAGMDLDVINAQQAEATRAVASLSPRQPPPPGLRPAPPPPTQNLDLTAFQNAQASALGIPALRSPAGRRRRHLIEARARRLTSVSPPAFYVPARAVLLSLCGEAGIVHESQRAPLIHSAFL